jgi:hypothetical protein
VDAVETLPTVSDWIELLSGVLHKFVDFTIRNDLDICHHVFGFDLGWGRLPLPKRQEFRFVVVNKDDNRRGTYGIFQAKTEQFAGILINDNEIVFYGQHFVFPPYLNNGDGHRDRVGKTPPLVIVFFESIKGISAE